MNKVTLIGRLVKDPDIRNTSNGTAVGSFSIAVDRKLQSKDGKKESDFIPIVVWGKLAESTAMYTEKGKLIAVNGRIQTRNYEDKNANKRFITEVVADEVQFLEWKGKDGQKANSAAAYISNNSKQIDADFTEFANNSNFPF